MTSQLREFFEIALKLFKRILLISLAFVSLFQSATNSTSLLLLNDRLWA